MVDVAEKKDSYREDEITLYDYMLVLWKRKYLIIAIFVVTVISASFISLRLPRTYRITTMMTPGLVGISSDGKLAYLDSVPNILASINEEAFSYKIIEALKFDRQKYSDIKFNTSVSKSSEVISIKYDTQDIETGNKIMTELLNQLQIYYNNRTAAGIGTIVRTIDTLKNKSLSIENKKMMVINAKKKIMSEIEMLKDTIDLLKATEKKLDGQIKTANENTKIIMQDRDELLKKVGKTESVALLLYSNTIQQNISYIDRLNEYLDKNKIEQKTTKSELSKKEIVLKDKDTEIKDIEIERQNILIDIRNLEIQQANVEGIKILQEPYVSPKPVGPHKRKIVMMAGGTALFVSIALILFIEYIRKMRYASK